VCDAACRRVKEKNPAYVAIHHIKDGMSYKRICDIVRLNEHSEVLAKFPEFEKEFQRIKTNYDNLLQELENDYAKIASIGSQKEFALAACKSRVPDALFSKRKTPSLTFKSYLAQVTTNRAAELIG
jgi:NAD-dependent SIR2 family protein deacetylase